MIKLFTENDLIRYVYGETTAKENIEIKEAIICDSDLESKYSDLQLDAGMLDQVTFKPSENTLSNILNYSLLYSINQKSK
ncbi:MAG: hypothetical protein OCD76_08715 [Reichenbachiella sp.]